MWFSLVVRITSNYSIWPLRLLCVLWLLDEIHNKKETQLFSMLGRLVSYTAPTNREKATQFDVHLAHKKTKFLNFIWLSVEKKFYRTEELGGNDVKLFRISLLGISRKEFRRWAASIAQTCVWHMRMAWPVHTSTSENFIRLLCRCHVDEKKRQWSSFVKKWEPAKRSPCFPSSDEKDQWDMLCCKLPNNQTTFQLHKLLKRKRRSGDFIIL